jgi:hypothetical protein
LYHCGAACPAGDTRFDSSTESKNYDEGNQRTLCAVCSTIAFVCANAYASDLVQQTALPSDCIPYKATKQ